MLLYVTKMLCRILQGEGGQRQFPQARGSRVGCKRFINVTVTFAIIVEIAFVCRFNVRISTFK